MKRVHILIAHDLYSATTTIGKWYIAEVPDECSWAIDHEANYFGHSLEDAVRAIGVKVYKKTAIPQDVVCRVGIHDSPKFGRELPILYNQPNGYEILSNGVSFKYTLVHGMNDHTETWGCPGVAKNRIESTMKIQGSLEKEFTAKIKQYISDGYEVYFKTINT